MSARPVLCVLLLLLAGCASEPTPPPEASYPPCAGRFLEVEVPCTTWIAPEVLQGAPTGDWTCVDQHNRTLSEYRLLRSSDGSLGLQGHFKSGATKHWGKVTLSGPDAPPEAHVFTLDGDGFFFPLHWQDGVSIDMVAWTFATANHRETPLVAEDVLLQEVHGSLWYTLRLRFPEGDYFLHPMRPANGGFAPMQSTMNIEFPDGEVTVKVIQADGVYDNLRDPNLLRTGPVLESNCEA
ncbi:MAG: hypothetical protein QOD77_2047 [Thermoplasmata archaeon]|jgi:hypothetical protein|nr:hypothetical protein [Thermoplasmata archaeon]